MLNSISPIDGRYEAQTQALQSIFSEMALMKYRLHVEVEYLIALVETGIIRDQQLSHNDKTDLRNIVSGFTENDALRIKSIEGKINHDVKAIEYFIKEILDNTSMGWIREWVHFGLTSQDINNSAFPLMIREAYIKHVIPGIKDVRQVIYQLAEQCMEVPMLAHTHGQPATPTYLEKK